MKPFRSILFATCLGLTSLVWAQDEPTPEPSVAGEPTVVEEPAEEGGDELPKLPDDYVVPGTEQAEEEPATTHAEPAASTPGTPSTPAPPAQTAPKPARPATTHAHTHSTPELTPEEASQEAAREAEEEAKDELIVQNRHKLVRTLPNGETAEDSARRQSSYSLRGYFAAEHNAYDGHSVLDHARAKQKFAPPFQGEICPDCGEPTYNFDPAGPFAAWTHHYTDGADQYSRFPIPLKIYTLNGAEDGMGLWEKLCHRVEVDNFNLAATLVFLFAILHTFMAPKFQSMAHHLEKKHKQKLRDEKFRILHPEQRVPVSFASTLCHFLGEVEVVFGLWLIPFFFVCKHYYSMEDFLLYIDHDTSFTEPLFVAVVMVIASSRPIYRLAENTLKFGASLGKGTPAAWWISVLCIAPLLGSFITEPAAMTLAAILLGKKFYQLKPSPALCYATLALLFVNVSVGGTLTHFAAPPIVMVAGKWDWGMGHMFMHFGWKAIAGITLSNIIYFFIFSKEFKRLEEVQRINSAFDGSVPTSWEDRQDNIPVWVYAASILFLAWTVYFAHHPAIFIGGFMFFLGFTMATPQYQNAFSIKVPMLVAFFLAGLLVMGGVQGWWMQPVLQALSELGVEATMGLASILTAFNDNASVTFLSSTVPMLPEDIKYAIVAGAVTGGGLTVIANAPNPAGQAILGKYFKTGISALQLFLWAALPTIIMFCMFNFIR